MRVLGNPLTRAVDAAAHGPELARRVTALLPRAVALLDAADRLVERIQALLDRLEGCEASIETVIGRVSTSERAARTVIDETADLQRRMTSIVETHEPALRQLLRTATYAGEHIGPTQVDALVAYLEFLPMLQTMDQELMPTLSTLHSVAPDLTELLAVSRGLNELMGSLPGLGKAKRRVDDELAKAEDAG